MPRLPGNVCQLNVIVSHEARARTKTAAEISGMSTAEFVIEAVEIHIRKKNITRKVNKAVNDVGEKNEKATKE